MKNPILLFLLTILSWACTPQKPADSSGKLFIIGGGDRSAALVEKMIQTADLGQGDYVFILPMASAIPDTTTKDISDQILMQGDYDIRSHNFTRAEAQHQKELIAAVSKARLIYIPGGDQNRFMDVVLDTPLYEALHQAYRQGATIAGTSAGAAVMSEIMLTGEQTANPDKDRFNVLWRNNMATASGLGFLQEDIIDQHFVRRSRFSRLIALLADYPNKQGIGIDERTAIICHNNQAEVVGEGQVVVLSAPKGLNAAEEQLIRFEDLKFSLLKEGDRFELLTKN